MFSKKCFIGLSRVSDEMSARNLGATAATFEGHGEGVAGKVGGLYYQFGNKTPFASTLGSPMTNLESSAQTFAWAIKNPTTWVAINTNWSTQDNSTSYMYNDKNVAKDTDGKSIFDPSPIGWKLPVRYAYSDFPANCTGISDNVATYSPASAKIYSTGVRVHTSSSFWGAGSVAYLWTSTPGSATNGYRLTLSNASATITSTARTYGQATRAIRE